MFGAPDSSSKVEYDEYLEDSVRTLYYPSAVATYYGEHLAVVTCLTEACRSPRGLGIGSRLDELSIAYADSGRTEPELGTRRHAFKFWDCWFDFGMSGDRVASVRMVCDYS